MSHSVAARDNLFASHRVEALPYRHSAFTWPALLGLLGEHDYRGAIVGPHGSGKTTLLDELVVRLTDAGHRIRRITLRSDDHQPLRRVLLEVNAPDLTQMIVIIDGAEQLTNLSWRRVQAHCRSARGLIITSHREGRLETIQRCATSPELLQELVSELAPGYFSDLAEGLRSLWSSHDGNLRLCLRDLYDRFTRPISK